jgi:lysozyme
MQASEDCLEFIRKKEAFFAHAYICPAGVWTIGYGTTRWDLKTPVKQGETITSKEADRQLAIEVQRCADAVTESVKVPLTQNEFDALVSFAYNVGTGWITGRAHRQAALVKLLNQGKREAVPGQLLLFCRTTSGKRLDGLYIRRKEEAQMWLAHDHSAVVAGAVETHPTVHEDGTVTGAMPQAVTTRAAVPAVANAAATSWTIRGAVAAALGVAGQAAEKATGYASGMAADISSQVEQSSPLRDLAGKFLAHTDWILLGLMGVGIVIVVSRRLSAAAQGREG